MPTAKNHPLFFISAGEPSGDIHAAALVRALRRRFPEARFVAFGGPELQKAGCEVPVLLTHFAVMWFRVLWDIPRMLGYLRRAANFFRREKPDLVILVDYPGFNWHIAKKAKEASIPVCYFMPPQLWGWASWRIKKMKRWVDFCLIPLAFEKKWFDQFCMPAVEMGHPFFSEIRNRKLDDDFLKVIHTEDQERPILLLLPGSRNQEVKGNFSDMKETVKRVLAQFPSVRPMIGAFKESQAQMIRAELVGEGLAWQVFVDKTPELMAECTFALAVSGSVSMELLAHKKPTVIYYRISRFAHWIMRRFIRVKYITLVNLLAVDRLKGEDIFYPEHHKMLPKEPTESDRNLMLFPEYLVDSNQSEAASKPLIEWLRNPQKRLEREAALEDLLRQVDDGSDPLERAAEAIEHFLLTNRRKV